MMRRNPMRCVRLLAIAASLLTTPAAAKTDALLIGRPLAENPQLAQLWAGLESAYGVGDLKVEGAAEPHDIGEKLRQFLAAPGAPDDMRLVWVAAEPSSSSVCPAWTEDYVRPAVPAVLVAPPCLKLLVQPPSTYEPLDAPAEPPASAGRPGVVFVSTAAETGESTGELVAALDALAAHRGTSGSQMLVAALTCLPKTRASVEFSPNAAAWLETPPHCGDAEHVAAPEAAAVTPPAPAPAEATAEPKVEPKAAAEPSPPPVPPVAAADDALADAPKPAFAAPVTGDVMSDFGSQAAGKANKGIDFEAAQGSPVKAAAAGNVVFVGDLAGYGRVVAIKHGNDWATVYGHVSSVAVTKGQTIAKGDTIASVDPVTNRVHFEIRRRGKAVDPRPLLAGGS